MLSVMLRDRKGVSSLEYAILAFDIIAAVRTTALTGFGGTLQTCLVTSPPNSPLH